jgi:16S rRNA (cytidine1402-2'-O)-methyltransferase
MINPGSELGKLYLVPSPIGNLEDMTFRAKRILSEVDLILAEDTRVSSRLLQHYQIDNKLKSFHQHNEHQQLDAVIDMLKSGQQIAVLSDAGTPGISDPGFLLVRACREEAISVECLPGASALIPALIDSGRQNDRLLRKPAPNSQNSGTGQGILWRRSARCCTQRAQQNP